ncbi:sphingomyelin phosphodiesterase [Malassezia sp. CBS 17886]|nr:sphingomyelin phosphodiesterase [Malassezia sp. CBS 17886]
MSDTVRVLTLNCWGLKYVSRRRRERLRAIADALAASPYDVIGLQEIWVESEDWVYTRDLCADAFPHATFFLTGAFGGGLGILSRYPIVDTSTHMYSLTGTPVYVAEGDWIAGKACGCATLQHPTLGLVDVWNTHLTAVGGQVGPETRRAYRVVEALELAYRCRASAERGRHVVCVGDLNSLQDSLCLRILTSIGGLRDSMDAVGAKAAHMDTVTCDAPANTWTAGKTLDHVARMHAGKRLDYILFRGPASGEQRLRCVAHRVVFTDLAPGLGVSYSDHFGVAATLVAAASGARDPGSSAYARASASDTDSVLGEVVPVLHSALVTARSQQRTHLGMFAAALALVGCLVVGNVCASAWLMHGRSVPASLITAVMLVPATWVGTTALYSGYVWGEWQKRSLRCALNRVEVLRTAARHITP